MNALDLINRETIKLGYRPDAVRRNYSYSDVWQTPAAAARSVPLAVFTQTPPSYRSAAFAVVEDTGNDPVAKVREHRALGAPLLFVIEGDDVSIWQVYASGTPRKLGQSHLSSLPELFEANKTRWAPDAIHRAKAIGAIDASYQLDFVDIGLIPAIEGEIHTKLDRLLHDALATCETRNDKDVRHLFRGIFRLLSAKILIDREHPQAAQWDVNNVGSILSGIGQYYTLNTDEWSASAETQDLLQPVWNVLQKGLNVANISADDLAYVYENTLVTAKTRKEFGTHSTPRHVAEYVVSKLRLWENAESLPVVYEPFSGAGVFLVSALRHMRDGLPHSWNDEARHNLLVKHIQGSEIDAFACEVAKLSLILADYPNANGWKIHEANLFEDSILAERMASADVILCNPPYEKFSEDERALYPAAAQLNGSKAIFALETALRSNAKALGFVVPRTLLVDRSYLAQRRAIEEKYSDVELVSLPDGVFSVSQVETALLIAKGLRSENQRQTIRSTEVDDRDKKAFAVTGIPSRVREIERMGHSEATGKLWITALDPVWSYLDRAPRFGSVFEGHWGVRWTSGEQASRSRSDPAPGFQRGFLNTTGLRQQCLGKPAYIDMRPAEIYGAGDLPWNRAKILCNAGRLSRKYWRLAAAVDREGFVASQQFIGLWPKSSSVDLDAWAAILNGPVINAYMAEHSFDKRFRIKTLLSAPVPEVVPDHLGEQVRRYRRALTQYPALSDDDLGDILYDIDAAVMSAYDLPPRLERALLSAFTGSDRPIAHAWKDWGVEDQGVALSLAERKLGLKIATSGDWIREKLTPLPSNEGELLAAYLR